MVNPIIVTKHDANDQVEIAFMWTGDSAQSYVFVNGLFCPEGGSPITGAKTTITTSMKDLVTKTLTLTLFVGVQFMLLIAESPIRLLKDRQKAKLIMQI